MTDVDDRPLDRLDHMDPAFTADPYPTWERMRAEGPVWRWEELDSYMVVDHVLAKEVLRDGETFTLDRYAWEYFDPGEGDAVRPLLTDTFENGIFQAGPADHSRLRKLVVPTFSPAAAERHRPVIQGVIDEIVDGWTAGEVVDLAAELSVEAPVRIISRLLGVDQSRGEWFASLASDFAAIADPTAAPEVLDRAEEQLAHFRDLLEASAGRPGLYAELLALQDGDDRLTSGEVVSLVVALMAAGMETTASAISLGAMALMSHPDQAALLRDDPTRWPEAVIEILRYSYIGYGLTRFTTREVDLGPYRLRKGQLLWVNVGAAMYDPAVYDSPATFDIGRSTAEPIPFGFGAHYCLGASLAKVEIECALRTILERFGVPELAGPVDWRTHLLLRGPSALPVRLPAPS